MEVNGALVANISSTLMEVEGELDANVSSSSMEIMEANGELVSNISTNRMEVNGASNANINGGSIVEVYEDRDVMLTFVMEAYPPIRFQRWMTPTHVNSNNNTVYQESYTVNGYRLAC